MSKKGGHHGGAWKVAYADFVTAMMALFIVLWLTSQDQKIKDAVARAFRNPFTSVTKESVGIIPSKDTQAVRSSSGNFDSASVVELNILRRLNQEFMKSLQAKLDEDQEGAVKLDMVPDGVRINVFDRARKPIFKPQSTEMTEYGNWVFSTLAWEIARYRAYTIELDGHTEAGNKPLREDYGDWEMTTDRANAVRRKLQDQGVWPKQIRKVVGFGATQQMAGYDATDEINRRVTVLLTLDENTKIQ